MDRTRTPPAPPTREQLIGALLPDIHAEPSPPLAVPLPVLPAPTLPASTTAAGLLIGMARADRSGRLHERRLLRALGWMPGQRLALDVVHGLIVVQPAPTGSHVLDDRAALHLPAATRRLCRINHGAPIVLTASVAQQTLVIHPPHVVARLLSAHHANLPVGRHER
ncbi:hypothetical protein [Pseudonocardia acaciae]|uniref:hypothetical protein n=1 Tax=Pseudonocardia acaciae TaxID=551276 RepID=UPI0012ECBE31|nr:hypothetical protein [Pseudonocardia acaciae]